MMRVSRGWARRAVCGGSLYLLLAMGALSFAGEPISFSGPKAAEKPVLPLTTQKVVPTIPKQANPFEFDDHSPGEGERRGYDRNRARRAKNARDERKNWMWVDAGDLQEKEDRQSDFGIRSYTIEESDDSSSGDLTFSESTDSSAAASEDRRARERRVPMHLLSPRERQDLEARAATDRQARAQADDISDDNGKRNQKPGAPTALGQELDLRSLMAAPDSSGKAGSIRTVSLSDVLGGNAKVATRPSDPDRSPSLRQMLGLPQPEQYEAPNRLDGVNVRPDFRLNPPVSVEAKTPPLESRRSPSISGSLPGAPLPWANPVTASPRSGLPELVTPARTPPPRDPAASMMGPNADKRGATSFDPPRRPGVLGR